MLSVHSKPLQTQSNWCMVLSCSCFFHGQFFLMTFHSNFWLIGFSFPITIVII